MESIDIERLHNIYKLNNIESIFKKPDIKLINAARNQSVSIPFSNIDSENKNSKDYNKLLLISIIAIILFIYYILM